ncbi:hypothetical protein GLW08_10385 [Pontibacillus yanchengensis]|uniref:Uncharacterized protein n=1 Tax=Pontibacillus yanchengensis TaxID=462910 RepID=A0ACC7VE73_9BACI|nr:hypothetical protein [Pontibacillus yanchengensis]
MRESFKSAVMATNVNSEENNDATFNTLVGSVITETESVQDTLGTINDDLTTVEYLNNFKVILRRGIATTKCD